jgi:hypothetical protein
MPTAVAMQRAIMPAAGATPQAAGALAIVPSMPAGPVRHVALTAVTPSQLADFHSMNQVVVPTRPPVTRPQ